MNRIIVQVVVFLSVLVASVLSIVLAARLVTHFQDGANPASALNIVPNKPIDWPIDLEWIPDQLDTSRPLDPFTRQQIEDAYISAWLQLTLSYRKGEAYGLETYFDGDALRFVESVKFSAPVEQIATKHRLEATLYSDDGGIVALTDHAATVSQFVAGQYTEEVSEYNVVMFLEDGRWRVRYWQRERVNVHEHHAPLELSSYIQGTNYYPKNTPWDLFWTEYDPGVIDKDIRLMQELGMNSVRIFIPYQQFIDDQSLLLTVLSFMDTLYSAEMGAVVTLFDFKTDYAMLTWPKADYHAREVVLTLREHPALLAWDIKNEPDLDYDTNGQLLVDAWLEHTVQVVRSYDNKTPITIGWSTPEYADQHAEILDFVSFHFYASPDTFMGSYNNLSALVTVPIVLTEFGTTSWDAWFIGNSQQEQADYYKSMLEMIKGTDLSGYMIWTLHDFPHVPDNVAGNRFTQVRPQENMGILDVDGDKKLAFDVIKRCANWRTLDR